MLGTIELTGQIGQRLEALKEAWAARKSMSLAARRELNHCLGAKARYTRRPHMAALMRGLIRCYALAEKFRVVDRDPAIKRNATISRDGYSQRDVAVKIPLVFACKLPAPRVHKETIIADGRETYSAKAIVPHPTPEALEALSRHRKLFDWVELWWVPNDVLVEKLPDPDPIIVGAVEIECDRTYYFELHRWVDETVELGWWSKEGY